jgi:hypothetical protein
VGARWALAALLLGCVCCQKEAATPEGPSAEAKAYLPDLKFSDVELKATEAYSGHQIVELLGRIKNDGDRRIRSVEVFSIFHDPYGQVVLRERQTIVKSRDGVFQPGDQRSFRLAFDTLPESWNQDRPQLVIANIQFE